MTGSPSFAGRQYSKISSITGQTAVQRLCALFLLNNNFVILPTLSLLCYVFLVFSFDTACAALKTDHGHVFIAHHDSTAPNAEVTSNINLSPTARSFTNQLALKIEGSSSQVADALAEKYGYTNLGPVIPGGDFYLFENKRERRKSSRKSRSLQGSHLARESNVLWAEQQVAKKRVKRGVASREPRQYDHYSRHHTPFNSFEDHQFNAEIYDHKLLKTFSHSLKREGQPGIPPRLPVTNVHFSDQKPPTTSAHDDYDGSPATEDLVYGRQELAGWNEGVRRQPDYAFSRPWRRRYGTPNDPFWKEMWYLHRNIENPSEPDHNVREAWDLGYTGRGVVVTILDDGLERTHPDISPNYDPDASYDVNDRDEDPTPRYEYTDENRHGTRCAGEVAAVFNNSLCVVGIAFNARIGGIRMLDGDVTDAVEATSLSHNFQHIDIYSASWGPDDDGRTVDGPAVLTRAAFERGINEGRQGKGSIFIWASGNGGKDADSCNCDGYTNSIYTLSISSATEHGNIPWYSEACSSTLATAYSSGATGEQMIVTTDLHHTCTKSHTGTSASAPLAAGIAALTLEANPDLNWRDLQHIVVRTAKPANLWAGDWKLNGVGRNVSHSFGYGLLDAGAMVRLAQMWRSVPSQKRCRSMYPMYPASYKPIPPDNRLLLQIYTDGCAGVRKSVVKYLEHVQSIVTLNAPRRGGIQIYLTSPKGTRSTLLAKRIRDTSRTGFREWAFMTTHNWGELAYGTWSLEIDNEGFQEAELLKWELVLYGTTTPVGPSGAELSVTQRSVGAARRGDEYNNSSAGQSPLILSTLSLILFNCIKIFSRC